MRRQHGSRRTTREWGRPGQHFVGKDSPRIDIGARVGERIGRRLLRRHIRRRAEGHSHRRQVRVAAGGRRTHCLGDAEVRDHRRVAREQDVVRFDIAVYDTLLVRRRERARDLPHHTHRFVDRQFPVVREPLAQRLTAHERHREVRQAADLAGGEKRHDVRVLQLRGECDLAAESVDGNLASDRLGKDLDDYVAAEGILARDEHARHAAAAKLTLQGVGSAERGLELLLERVAQRLLEAEGNPRRGGTSKNRVESAGNRQLARIRICAVIAPSPRLSSLRQTAGSCARRAHHDPEVRWLTPRSATFFCAWLLVAAPLALRGQLLETEKARPHPKGYREVSAGIELQTSNQGSETAVPLAFEFLPTSRLELVIEPVAYAAIRPKTGRHATGLGDVELTALWFVSAETARMPAFAVAAEAKVPTARNALIGTGEADFSGFLIASKRLGRFDNHVNVGYTIVGVPRGSQLGNLVTFAAATEFALSPRTEVFAELLGNAAVGGEGGSEAAGATSMVPEAAGGEFVTTVGMAQWITRSVRLSFGVSHDNTRAWLFHPGLTVRFP